MHHSRTGLKDVAVGGEGDASGVVAAATVKGIARYLGDEGHQRTRV